MVVLGAELGVTFASDLFVYAYSIAITSASIVRAAGAVETHLRPEEHIGNKRDDLALAGTREFVQRVRRGP